MQAWQQRMFERYGSRYVIGAVCAFMSALVFVVFPAIAIVTARYEGLGISDYALVTSVTAAIALASLAGAMLSLHRPVRALLRWADTRDASLARDARVAAFDGPRRVTLRGIPLATLGVPGIVALTLVPGHHTSALDWTEFLIGVELAVVFAALNLWFTLDVILQPIRAALGGPSPNERRTSLIARLALVVPAVIIVATLAVGFLTTTRAHAGAGHLLVIYGIAALCFVLNMMIVAPLFASGVVTPFGSLARATREIAAGDQATRVPVIATDELGRLAESFNEMLEELQASRERIVAASDTARRRVERDLHDGAQQRLVMLNLKLGMLKQAPHRDDLIDEIQNDLVAALAELRDLARGLYPQLLESDGLGGALAEASERAPLATTVECDGVGRYRPEVEAAVYFCCLEALQNAGKHAGPGATARIELRAGDHALTFSVIDNGAGFDPASVNGSSGLQNMADRLGALGGSVKVESSPGRGTTIAGSIPIGQN
jgi:signal transduction histidine kinase